MGGMAHGGWLLQSVAYMKYSRLVRPFRRRLTALRRGVLGRAIGAEDVGALRLVPRCAVAARLTVAAFRLFCNRFGCCGLSVPKVWGATGGSPSF
jgi:hypothetical protein